jgi:tellurite resistance protein TerC
MFPFAEYWWLYVGFTALVVVLLAVDLGFHRRQHVISFRNAALWTVLWMALAFAFSYVVYWFVGARAGGEAARRLSLEFLAGYIVEWSLSVDNMFVFALVFRYFAVPSDLHHRVLFYGVLGAMGLRAVFIGLGAALSNLHWVMVLFGVFLIVTGIRMALERSDKQIDPSRSPIVRWAARLFPVTPGFEGARFLVRRGGKLHLTPLMLVLLALETTDLVFAVDSVPAVFGVTREPLIVYTSNVFAVLGLRAMYFLLSGALGRFHLLKYGLAIVLVFVGLKMVWLDTAFGGRFPIGISLGIIAGLIGGSMLLSVVPGLSRRRASPDNRPLAP